MNRDFYFFGILFLGLYVGTALFQSIIFFQIGTQLYYVNSFAAWTFVSISTSLVGSAFMLNYFQDSQVCQPSRCLAPVLVSGLIRYQGYGVRILPVFMEAWDERLKIAGAATALDCLQKYREEGRRSILSMSSSMLGTPPFVSRSFLNRGRGPLGSLALFMANVQLWDMEQSEEVR